MEAEKVAGVVGFIFPPSGTTVAQWVAKSREESSHRETVVNVGGNPPKRHVGLWQIQETHVGVIASTAFMTPDRFVEWLKDPFNNFRVAKKLYEAGGWAPWNASGGSPNVTPDDTIASEGATWNDPTDIITDPLKSVEDILGTVAEPLIKAGEWLGNPSNWTRIVQVAGGLALALVAAALFVKPVVTDTIKSVRPI